MAWILLMERIFLLWWIWRPEMTKETWAVPQSPRVAKLHHSSRIPGFQIPLQACTILNCYWWALHALQSAIHSTPTHTLSSEVQAQFLKQLKRKGNKHQGRWTCYHDCVSVGEKNCRSIVLPLLFNLFLWNEIWCKENLSPWDVSFCPHL